MVRYRLTIEGRGLEIPAGGETIPCRLDIRKAIALNDFRFLTGLLPYLIL
jgi:hypothetical protein